MTTTIPPRREPPRPLPDAADPYLDVHGVCSYFGNISDTTLWRWQREQGFPDPDLRVARRRLWRLSTVKTWRPKAAATGAEA